MTAERVVRTALALAGSLVMLLVLPAGIAAADAAVTLVTTEFKFEPKQLEVAGPGPLSVTLQNKGVIEHDFTVEGIEGKVVAQAGETAEGVLELAAPGTYSFVCSIPGHKEAGMQGTLVVAAAAGDEAPAPGAEAPLEAPPEAAPEPAAEMPPEAAPEPAAGPAGPAAASALSPWQRSALWLEEGGQARPFGNGQAVALRNVDVELFVAPYPPLREGSIDLYVTDRATGRPVEGSGLGIIFDMAMPHGNIRADALPTGGGHYLVPYRLVMPGEWRIDMTVGRGRDVSTMALIFRVD